MSRKILVFTTSAILSIVLLIHFSFTFLYLSPANPFKSKHWDMIIGYMNPLFTQNWKLFAPNPASQQENLDIRVQYVDNQGATRETDWKSITLPVIKELQSNRFSTNARFSEFQSSLISDFVWGEKEDKESAFRSMQTYVKYVLTTKKFTVPGTINKIQLRAVINKFPDYENRTKPDSAGKISYYYSNWWEPSSVNTGGGKA
ncbi:DUF5819 family protein [Shimazuella sp. AN120528]|uniref:DUF5819 family protein n=1 Tax=Shimazuella soli TaxID=1892854 RepID=UPI001F0D0F5D|nr:DUF5819 family protein [Shimazuella soli]MCH5585162.1 DUF5819 family protein [Shimazuella soli]